MQGKNKVISNNNKKTRKIDDPKDYEDSSIKDTMEDLENKAKSALHSAPEISENNFQIVKKQQKRYCKAVAIIMIPPPAAIIRMRTRKN